MVVITGEVVTTRAVAAIKLESGYGMEAEKDHRHRCTGPNHRAKLQSYDAKFKNAKRSGEVTMQSRKVTMRSCEVSMRSLKAN